MTDEPRLVEHIRRRPSWDCARCGQPWPCANAKENLLREFGDFPSVLTIFMATQMYDAFDDLATRGGLPPRQLNDRFLAWIVIPSAEQSTDSPWDTTNSTDPAPPAEQRADSPRDVTNSGHPAPPADRNTSSPG